MLVLINAKDKAITFEKEVACFGRNLKKRREKGTVMAPPEIPEIDPIPDKREISKIPKTSIPYF